MTTDREVMQQALEALETGGWVKSGYAIAALCARLAEPETCKPALQVERADARRPLTDEEMHGLCRRAGLEAYYPRDGAVQYEYERRLDAFARAIERAHKIGGGDDE